MRTKLLSVTFLAVALSSGTTRAEPTSFAVRVLGTEAMSTTAKRKAIVRHAATFDARALGLHPIAPGMSVIDGDGPTLAGFARAHLDFDVELPPPLHIKLDLARKFVGALPAQLGSTALDGTGTYVGIVDTGLDIFHNDFRNADGTTRIAYFLDFSQTPRADHPLDVEYCGRVFDRAAINAILGGDKTQGVPNDDDGHGTHVTGIAAGNGGPSGKYVGLAPKADLVIVKASDAEGNVDEAMAILGVKFVFDRAKADARPASVNMSLGTQFGAHDGSSSFEAGLVALAAGPGRALSVAASNEGAFPIHTGVHVSKGARFSIPVNLPGVDGNGREYSAAQVYIWINLRDHGDLSVGVKGPDGSEWMPQLPRGQAGATKPTGDIRVIVSNDDSGDNAAPSASCPQPAVKGRTSSAVVVLSGPLPVGNFSLELEGEGTAEIWLQGNQQAIDGPGMPRFPRGAEMSGTIGIPASAAGLLAIGCVGARDMLTDSAGKTFKLDSVGLSERCFYSSAGPAANGALRPDVLAPGYYVISSLAHSAFAIAPNGDFSLDQIVDPEHAALSGTSMSAPFGTGAAALLFQRDPTLTQEDVRSLLMASARPLHDDPPQGGSPTDFARGLGIMDVGGAVAAYERRAKPPKATSLRLRLGDDWLAADGQLPLWGVATAHDDEGKPADVDGGLALESDGANAYQTLEHPAVGVYRFAVVAQKGRGLTKATLHLRGTLSLDREVPIGADRWDALYGVGAGGGCSFGRSESTYFYGLLGVFTVLRRCRFRSRAAARAARSNATASALGRRR